MIKIKILLATYNGEKYIREQMDSILNQQGIEVNVAVSDDGSKDKTLEIIKHNYPEILISQNIPGTGSAAKNFLKMVSELTIDDDFDYIAFSDQDDIWLPEKMKKAVEILQKENSDLYCSNLTKWDTSTGSLTELKKDFPQKKYDFLFEGGSAGCTYVLTRKLVFQLKEFVNKRLDNSDWNEFSHDWLIYFFARYNGYKVSIDSNSYIHYRIHDSNVHGHLNKISLSTIKSKFSKVLNGYHDVHARNFIEYVDKDTKEYTIYKAFLGGYFNRNKMIFKYNTQLMRDKKKLTIFMLLNLFKFK
ncbi:glycosyltransferase [Chryseobacterium bernardetii]|jgi:rhamnosyltransferase|uniref:Glycosyltransferase n=1 Tax=Chryseobacterium bernardetii TaxID=1241978 RepID=A0A3G6TIA9_9FLAO|nr:glycosyltransferase [Chryseobacterium bernardetii]AZB27489.1 glycosyltransferase [Chryseobacterium bernardetii]